MKAIVFSEILEKLNRGKSADLLISCGDKTYIRRFKSRDRLILLGCGHVSLDVYRIARMLDFSIIAADDRPAFANSERFPDARVICDSFAAAIDKLGINSRDYVCVLTRGHRWDRECIEAIFSGDMPYYLGMISSKTRADGLRRYLAEQGYPHDRIESLHAPVGLRIGGGTTAEIAVSICAELIQERSKIRTAPEDNELEQTNINMELLRYLADGDEPRAMITVLSSAGSTPVKSGSMMAVDRIGTTVGTIGGGCSEAAAIAKARRIIGTGQSKLIDIDMSNDAAADSGMVCGGEMTVLIEDIS